MIIRIDAADVLVVFYNSIVNHQNRALVMDTLLRGVCDITHGLLVKNTIGYNFEIDTILKSRDFICLMGDDYMSINEIIAEITMIVDLIVPEFIHLTNTVGTLDILFGNIWYKHGHIYIEFESYLK